MAPTSMSKSPLSATPTGVRVVVWAKPRSAKSRVLGVKEAALEVAIAAPPVDGAANAELIQTLARFFAVGKSAVAIARGATGRNKVAKLDALPSA
jgi:uncharacterized protein (TIGR00251 family)